MPLLAIKPEPMLIKSTTSRCPECLREVRADVVQVDDAVWMSKSCPEHGRFAVKIANDARFYHRSIGARGEGCCSSACGCEAPSNAASRDPFETLSTCIALIEIVESCNLKCPTCYAASPFGVDDQIDCVPFDTFVERVQGVIDRKRKGIDILQLSGGEPTIHPKFFEILEWSLANPDIGYVLLNTNGVRVARERAFRERLGELHGTHGKFELYLQFDGPQEEGQRELRAADLRRVREDAIDGAGALGVPTTLAMVVNDTTMHYLGDTLHFGLERPHCRGITFQPMFTSGRVGSATLRVARHERSPSNPAIQSKTKHHTECGGTFLHARCGGTAISVGDVILQLVDQSEGLVSIDDFTPLPCGDPNCHTIGYLIRTSDGPVGLGSLIDLNSVQGFLEDRVDYRIEDLAKCGCDNEPLGDILKEFEIGPDQPFRLFIKPFMDAWTFDQDRIDRCCTHVIRPDGRLDSFCRHYLERQREAARLTE